MLSRFYSPLEPYLEPNKVLVLYGPRRVGKTTLLKQMLDQTALKYRLESGENIRIQELLGSNDFDAIKSALAGYDLLAIDEAQQIPNIGLALKIIVDHIPGIRVIVTGSSSFDLQHQVGEPLVGRKKTLTLYPIAQCELAKSVNAYDLKNRIEEFLLFGSYPDVITASGREEKIAFLNEIADSYLLKDVLALDGVKKSRTLVDLVKLLALQVGNEVSLNELSNTLDANIRTVEKYLDILEKGFVIASLGALKRNLRNEVRGKRKYYFYDTGVRNAILAQFNRLSERNDVGALWENFLFIERMKRNEYQRKRSNRYYWRTYEQNEIDYIEEYDGALHAYEFKWKNAKTSSGKKFLHAYEQASLEVITNENYWDFLVG